MATAASSGVLRCVPSLSAMSSPPPMRAGWRPGCSTAPTFSGNLRAVQTLLGHASVATTERYTAVDDNEIRAAMMAALSD